MIEEQQFGKRENVHLLTEFESLVSYIIMYFVSSRPCLFMAGI